MKTDSSAVGERLLDAGQPPLQRDERHTHFIHFDLENGAVRMKEEVKSGVGGLQYSILREKATK